MNRLKVWLFTLLVVAAAVLTLRAHTVDLRARAIAQIDARLAAALAQAGAATRALGRETGAAAALVGRDEDLVRALHAKEAEPPPAPVERGRRGRRAVPPPQPRVDEEAQEALVREAARAALASAEKSFGFALPAGTVVTAGNREWLARRGEPSAAEGEAMTYLRGAIGGRVQRGLVRLNGEVFSAAASPAGAAAGVVVLAPLDDAWAKDVAAATGVEVTLAAPGVKLVSTLAPADAQIFSPWSLGTSTTQGVGRLAKLDVSIGPVRVPPLPLLFGDGPARRARALALEGVGGGYAIVSLPTAAALTPIVTFQWQVLAGLGAVLLVGIAVGLLVRVHEPPVAVPAELLAAAQRIEKGDFAARAPPLAGKLGTVAAALNRAAELAGPAAAAATAGAVPPSMTDEFFARPLDGPPPQRAEPLPIAPPPLASPPLAPPSLAPPPLASPSLAEPDLLQGVPAASREAEEEAHWKQVFQDFLRTRASCGEASEGLTYEKFRLKLEGNKAALVAKYACKTVKFQVYVKDGKAALKATPVK